jgi:iron complex transport system substrate-binding protein
VSHECDHPPEVAGRPVLTSSRLPGAGASGDLDRSVRELLRAAGSEPLGVAAGERAPTLDPEVVVVKPCGYPVERTLAELELLSKALPWERWPAMRAGRCTWPTATPTSTAAAPRIVDSAELLAACLHPGRFPDHLERYAAAARRVDAGLRIHPAGA